MNAIVIPLLAALGPLAVFLLMAVAFAETGLLAGFFLPGDSMLFAAGVFIASSVINLPLWLVVAAVAIAAVLGDQVGYVVGRRYGPQGAESAAFAASDTGPHRPRREVRRAARGEGRGARAVRPGRAHLDARDRRRRSHAPAGLHVLQRARRRRLDDRDAVRGLLPGWRPLRSGPRRGDHDRHRDSSPCSRRS